MVGIQGSENKSKRCNPLNELKMYARRSSHMSPLVSTFNIECGICTIHSDANNQSNSTIFMNIFLLFILWFVEYLESYFISQQPNMIHESVDYRFEQFESLYSLDILCQLCRLLTQSIVHICVKLHSEICKKKLNDEGSQISHVNITLVQFSISRETIDLYIFKQWTFRCSICLQLYFFFRFLYVFQRTNFC